MPAAAPPTPASERGFTPVPNCYLCGPVPARLSALELRVLLWVIRQTLGWRVSTVSIHPPELGAELRTRRTSINRVLRHLVEKGMILCRASPAGDQVVSLRSQEDALAVSPGRRASSSNEIIERRGNAAPEPLVVSPRRPTESWDKPLDLGVVREGLDALSAVLVVPRGRRVTPDDRAKLYLGPLTRCQMTEGKFLAACARAMSRNRFFPTPAELIELSTEVHKPAANASQTPKPKPRPRKWPPPEPSEEEFQAALTDLKTRLGLEGGLHAGSQIKPHNRP